MAHSQRILWLLEDVRVPYSIKTYKRDPQTMLAPPAFKDVHPQWASCPSSPSGSAPSPSPRYESSSSASASISAAEEWMRCRYFMHYAEGSLMTLLTVALVVENIKTAPVPFLMRPITSQVASKISRIPRAQLRNPLCVPGSVAKAITEGSGDKT
ncbi:hypothetical protein B0H10DRAFT_2206751 [Mycena sp. CBHHK59/15]|nr:hypothetical protein B0H10DRAFT_2206751 [Mycena sp. CBHHK59/15]